VVIGASQRSSACNRSRAQPAKHSSNDAGSCPIATGGISAAAAARQKGVAISVSVHHRRQRTIVWRLTPTHCSSSWQRAGVGPQRSTTTAPR
jgi:hypothetical protein